MSQVPDPYDRQSDFTSFAPEDSGQPQVGNDLENEFNEIKNSIDQTQDRLAEIQRDDGALANQSVHVEALSSAVRALLALSGAVIRGPWVTATAYAVGDVVTESDATFLCATAHTSGTFATDLASGKWVTLNQAAFDVSAFMLTVLDDEDAETARDTLGANDADNLSAGTVPAARMPAHTGDVTSSAGSVALTIAAGALSADAAGRAKMANGFFSADSTGLAKFADGFLTADATGLAKMAAGFLQATANGLAKMADGFLQATTAGRAKMADAYVTAAKLIDGILSADAAGRLKMADSFVTTEKLEDGSVTMAKLDATLQDVLPVKIESQDASSSTNIDFDLPAGYRRYWIEYDNVVPATDGAELNLRMSTDGGSSFASGASDYSWSAVRASASAAAGDGDASDSEITLTHAAGGTGIENTASDGGASGDVKIINPASTSNYKHVYGTCSMWRTDGDMSPIVTAGAYKSATAVDAVRFLMSSGNIASGTFTLWASK